MKTHFIVPDTVIRVIQKVDELLDAGTYLDYMKCHATIPNGVLHFKTAESVPDRNWEVCRFLVETNAASVELKVQIGAVSSIDAIEENEISWSNEEAFAQYQLSGLVFTLPDVRNFLAAMVLFYSPFSISVTTKD